MAGSLRSAPEAGGRESSGQRHNSVRSRNIRLAAIRSFFRLVALRDPDSVDLAHLSLEKVGLATRVLAIPIKRCDKPLVGYLTQPEMEAMISGRAGEQRKL
jgi:integrase/recombinase XerD